MADVPNQFRVLWIDTSLRATGLGIVRAQEARLQADWWGTLRQPRSAPRSVCLAGLARGVAERIAEFRPDVAAIEGVFFSRNLKTAVSLGEARGAVIAACAAAGVPVFEYAPRRVKQAVVGFGGAGKEQVRKMVMSILGLSQEPTEDESDALALAICHLHNQSVHAALAPTPI